jgi:hypothetical protein
MRRLAIYLFSLILLLRPFSTVAQSANKLLKEQENRFIRQLNNVSLDSGIVRPISRYADVELNNIHKLINSEWGLLAAEKEKALRSLVYFLQQLGENIAQQKSDIYDVAGSLESYESILKALAFRKSFGNLLIPLGQRRSQLLATAFREYKEHVYLDNIAIFKRMASTPEFIIRFLETKPDFYFADSLLATLAVYDPKKIFNYVNQGRTVLMNNLQNTENIYLRQLVTISNDRNASELLPFIIQLAEYRLTGDTVLQTRTDVVKYFQLLVNTLRESNASKDSTIIFQKLLRRGLKEKSLSFYVDYINEQHGASDAVRFAAVKGLRPEDIYYIITSTGEELYTSSYLGLYKRLMEHFKTQSADSLFQIVQYDNFRTFIRLAANYNVLDDFLSKMQIDKTKEVLSRFIGGIETDPNSGLEKAMDIADSFTGFDSVIAIRDIMKTELQSNLDRCRTAHSYFGVKLYSILLEVFDVVNQKNSANKLWTTLGNYEILKQNTLQNKKNEIIELVLFYGDEDGVASFANFQKMFSDTSKWKTTKNNSWISVRSVSDQPIVIYANRPLDYKEELDLRAQDSLMDFLKLQSEEPTVLVHRGHSYHLEKTLQRLQPSVKLAILGSCGSYNKAISIATINPDVQIIGSKKTGAKSINDPIIQIINETLMSRKDLYWPEIWASLASRFSKDEATLNLFNEYIPPGKNLGLFVLKLYNFYNRAA